MRSTILRVAAALKTQKAAADGNTSLRAEVLPVGDPSSWMGKGKPQPPPDAPGSSFH
jgi:hypothetical protein